MRHPARACFHTACAALFQFTECNVMQLQQPLQKPTAPTRIPSSYPFAALPAVACVVVCPALRFLKAADDHP